MKWRLIEAKFATLLPVQFLNYVISLFNINDYVLQLLNWSPEPLYRQ